MRHAARLSCWIVAAAVVVAGCGHAAAQSVLTDREVLESVARALPQLERARQQVRLAEGEATESRGAFDLKVKADALGTRGYYDNERFKAVIEQPLAPLGLTTFGGYRAGSGVFAPYDGKAQTLSDGELLAGFSLPLLRNRGIDDRRAGVRVADLGVELAGRDLEKARLTAYKEALSEYWDWVSAGQQRRVAQSLLDIAEARDGQLGDAVALGQVAAIERTDNLRAILQRRSALATAQRQLELQSIDLSLYLRGADGLPVRPAGDRLPALPDAAAPADPDEATAIADALARRPELRALRLKRAQQDVELNLAGNGLLPELDLYAQSSRDYGTGPVSRTGTDVEVGFTFELPFQRRKAEGKTAQVRAKQAVIDQELRWAEDKIRAEVQDALSALTAARAVLAAVSEELAVARELEMLERDRFDLGDSTQFMVNLRELTTADAALRQARALADVQKALVGVEAATGRLLDRVP